LKSRALRENLGKRRVTRCHPWLALQDQPFRRLGALVFRLGQLRNSHNGLAPTMSSSDQDPDSRLCDRFYLLTTPSRKNVFCSLRRTLPSNDPSNLGRFDSHPRKGFLRHKRVLKQLSPDKKKGKASMDLPGGDECFVTLVQVIPRQVAPQQSLRLFHRTRILSTGATKEATRPMIKFELSK
jgi:hypothetical protein